MVSPICAGWRAERNRRRKASGSKLSGSDDLIVTLDIHSNAAEQSSQAVECKSSPALVLLSPSISDG